MGEWQFLDSKNPWGVVDKEIYVGMYRRCCVNVFCCDTIYYEYTYDDMCWYVDEQKNLTRLQFYRHNFYDKDGFVEVGLEDDFKCHMKHTLDYRSKSKVGMWYQKYSIIMLKYECGSLETMCEDDAQYLDREDINILVPAIESFIEERELPPKTFFPLKVYCIEK